MISFYIILSWLLCYIIYIQSKSYVNVYICSGYAGENKHDNSSVRLDHLLTTPATASLIIHSHINIIIQSVQYSSESPDSELWLRTPAPDSRVLLTSLNHTSQLYNIIPFLLQHESTSQFTTKSFNLVTDQEYIHSPAIHTSYLSYRHKIVPLASKPITPLPDLPTLSLDITPTGPRHHFGGQSESPTGTRGVYD